MAREPAVFHRDVMRSIMLVSVHSGESSVISFLALALYFDWSSGRLSEFFQLGYNRFSLKT